MTDYPTTPDLRILAILAGLAGHFGKLWCFPSGEKIRELLAERYGRKMSTRTLWRHLGALERDHYIRRQRRHRQGNGRALELHSTIYELKARAVQALKGLTAFMLCAATHPWAKRWFSAVPKAAQGSPPQGDFMLPCPPSGPPADAEMVSRLRRAIGDTAKALRRA